MFQAVYRIIGRANHFHIHLPQNITGTEFCRVQHGARFFINLCCRVFIEYLRDPERLFQFQVCPVIERITQCVWYGFCPFLEFFTVTGIPGDELFRYPVSPHGPPFIMISF